MRWITWPENPLFSESQGIDCKPPIAWKCVIKISVKKKTVQKKNCPEDNLFLTQVTNTATNCHFTLSGARQSPLKNDAPIKWCIHNSMEHAERLARCYSSLNSKLSPVARGYSWMGDHLGIASCWFSENLELVYVNRVVVIPLDNVDLRPS